METSFQGGNVKGLAVYDLYLGEAPLLSCLPLSHLFHGDTVGCGHLQPLTTTTFVSQDSEHIHIHLAMLGTTDGQSFVAFLGTGAGLVIIIKTHQEFNGFCLKVFSIL
jgi:hypothetical protein